jgi:DNA mismatch repair protein MutL
MISTSVKILDDTVVNQIAAGEVVERPASVVKELVENALDAKSSEVTISIFNGGKSAIEVLDNGSGMSKADALLAIERFGTSKIRSIEDLFEVGSFGFRGEALPSIASVARMKLQTCVEGSTGVLISIHGGKLREVSETSLPSGTRIEVKNLFYNVPARRKFLKGEATETGLVKALLSDFAISHPRVRFRLVVDGKEAKLYPVANDFFERALQVGCAKSDHLRIDREFQAPWGEFRLRALLSHPVGAISSAAKLRILVNGRSVREKLVLGAVREGFGNFLKSGKYPSGVVSISIAPSEVDVNVHPQKNEVRFRQAGAVFGMISSAIRTEFQKTNPESLLGYSEVTSYEYPQKVPTTIQWGVGDAISTEINNSAPPDCETTLSYSESEKIEDSNKTLGSSVQDSSTPYSSLNQMRYLGQILSLYLLFEGERSLHIVDMHAAHERVQFYRLKKQYSASGVQAQQLLLPETLTLSPDKRAQFDLVCKELGALGIECELFGEDSIIIRSSPSLLSNVNVAQLVEEILALPDWGDSRSPVENRIDAAISTLACHRSIRRGRELEPAEVYQLLEDLEAAQNSAFCPHGRPVVTSISEAELEALFGRSGF